MVLWGVPSGYSSSVSPVVIRKAQFFPSSPKMETSELVVCVMP